MGSVDPEVSESIVQTYRQWCKYYDKSFDSRRLKIFQTNYLKGEQVSNDANSTIATTSVAHLQSTVSEDPPFAINSFCVTLLYLTHIYAAMILLYQSCFLVLQTNGGSD